MDARDHHEAAKVLEEKEPREASAYFAERLDRIEEAVCRQVICRQASPPLLRSCLWILCAGTTAQQHLWRGTVVVVMMGMRAGEGSPEEVRQEVERKRAGKSNVCGKIWKSGDLAYKCRNCGYDEPWCLSSGLALLPPCKHE